MCMINQFPSFFRAKSPKIKVIDKIYNIYMTNLISILYKINTDILQKHNYFNWQRSVEHYKSENNVYF